jgi:hypothetical protein
LSKFEQNFFKQSNKVVGMEMAHLVAAWNAQVAGRAATMRWWQQRM